MLLDWHWETAFCSSIRWFIGLIILNWAQWAPQDDFPSALTALAIGWSHSWPHCHLFQVLEAGNLTQCSIMRGILQHLGLKETFFAWLLAVGLCKQSGQKFFSPSHVFFSVYDSSLLKQYFDNQYFSAYWIYMTFPPSIC